MFAIHCSYCPPHTLLSLTTDQQIVHWDAELNDEPLAVLIGHENGVVSMRMTVSKLKVCFNRVGELLLNSSPRLSVFHTS